MRAATASKVQKFEVVPVSKTERPVVWPMVSPWLDAALKEFPSLITIESMKDHIESSAWELWVVRFGWEIQAAFVTEIVHDAGGSAVNIIAMGGKGMDYWIEPFSDRMAEFAREMHCQYVIEMGRPGWARVLRPLGWVDGPLVMIRRIA